LLSYNSFHTSFNDRPVRAEARSRRTSPCPADRPGGAAR